MAVQADVIYLKDPKVLAAIIEQVYDNVVASYESHDMTAREV